MDRSGIALNVRRRTFLAAATRGMLAFAFAVIISSGFAQAAEPAFKVLAFYSTDVEPDHVKTAKDALAFYSELAAKHNFILDTTTDWNKLNENDFKPYRLILWLNNFPQTPEQRAAFEKYMENGGGWLGFPVGGYNDYTTKWSWVFDFIGRAVVYSDKLAPLPAKFTGY